MIALIARNSFEVIGSALRDFNLSETENIALFYKFTWLAREQSLISGPVYVAFPLLYS